MTPEEAEEFSEEDEPVEDILQAWHRGRTEVRVKFGPRPNQTLPADLAEAVLTELRDLFPVQFGQALARALVGPDAVKTKRNGTRAG